MKDIIQILHEGQFSCVIKKNDAEIFTFNQRGIKDLYDLSLRIPKILHNAMVADKVIGKAAAALLIIGGVKAVYADVISTSALTLLLNFGIEVQYLNKTFAVLNRDKTNLCPVEKLCIYEDSPSKIIEIIDSFINLKK